MVYGGKEKNESCLNTGIMSFDLNILHYLLAEFMFYLFVYIYIGIVE